MDGARLAGFAGGRAWAECLDLHRGAPLALRADRESASLIRSSLSGGVAGYARQRSGPIMRTGPAEVGATSQSSMDMALTARDGARANAYSAARPRGSVLDLVKAHQRMMRGDDAAVPAGRVDRGQRLSNACASHTL